MRFLICLLVCFAISCANPVRAQETQDDLLNYIPATYENMAFALWAMGAYNVTDDAAVDSYLQVSKCKVFEKYREDDFIWQNIREGARREIVYFAQDYPNRFYIDSLVALGRYDFESAAFKLLPEFQFTNTGTIRFPFYSKNFRICGSDEYRDYFSRFMSFASDTEYSLLNVPIPPDKANALLAEISNYYYPSLPETERLVPIRFEITITGVEILDDFYNHIIFTGDMDRIQVFSNPERTNVIWSKQFKVFE